MSTAPAGDPVGVNEGAGANPGESAGLPHFLSERNVEKEIQGMRTVGFVHRAGRRALHRGTGLRGRERDPDRGRASSLASAAPAHRPTAAKTRASETDSTPVDINAADSEKLATLPGIGPRSRSASWSIARSTVRSSPWTSS
jgi:hypothetical protein